jgi:hypothetical protein
MTATGASASSLAGSNRLQQRAAGQVNGMCIERKRGGKGCAMYKAYSAIITSNRVIEAFSASIISSRITESESLEMEI